MQLSGFPVPLQSGKKRSISISMRRNKLVHSGHSQCNHPNNWNYCYLSPGLFQGEAPQQGRGAARDDSPCPGFCPSGCQSGQGLSGMAGPCAAAPNAGCRFTSQGHPAVPPFVDEAVVFSFKINAYGNLSVELQPLSSPPLKNTPEDTDMK